MTFTSRKVIFNLSLPLSERNGVSFFVKIITTELSVIFSIEIYQVKTLLRPYQFISQLKIICLASVHSLIHSSTFYVGESSFATQNSYSKLVRFQSIQSFMAQVHSDEEKHLVMHPIDIVNIIEDA